MFKGRAGITGTPVVAKANEKTQKKKKIFFFFFFFI